MDRAQEIGLFRWRIVGEATDVSLSARERGRLVRVLAEREHLDPDGRWVRVGRNTLDRWIRAYREGGFDGLVPAPRRVANGTPPRVLELAVALRREQPARTAAQIHRIIVEAEGAAPSARTIQRHFAAAGLPWKGSAVARALGRFEAEARNELWTGDAERHEALWNRAVMKGHRGQFVAADWRSWGQPSRRRRTARVESSPDNDGTGQYCQMARARQARREGVREKPAVERLSSKFHQLQSGGYGLGSGAHPPAFGRRGTPGSVFMSSVGRPR